MATTIPTPHEALELACKISGSSTALAERLSARRTARGLRPVSKASVSRWKVDRVPVEICPDIEAITAVRCELLRPDVDWPVLRRNKAKVVLTPAPGNEEPGSSSSQAGGSKPPAP